MSSEQSNANPTSRSSSTHEPPPDVDHQTLYRFLDNNIQSLSKRITSINARLGRLERAPEHPPPEEPLKPLDLRSDPPTRIELILELLESEIRHNNRLLEDQARDRSRGRGDGPPRRPPY